MPALSAPYMVKVFSLQILICLLAWISAEGQNTCMRGVVYDSQTGGGVVNVHVLVVGGEKGVLTDSVGQFELCGLREGDAVEFKHLAYYSRIVVYNPDFKDDLLIRLQPSSMTVDEVVVVGSADYSGSVIPGRVSIGVGDIVNLPSLMGESDVVRSLQTQAGVQSTGEGISDVFVRGGAPGQNMIVLDGMELMNPMHMMGLYSVFNPNTLAGVDLYKGHAPMTYSERLSSLILVSSADPLTSQTGTNVSVGTLSYGLGHISRSEDGKLGINIGARRSFLELYRGLSRLFIPKEEDYFGTTFSTFYDLNGLLAYKPVENGCLSVGWFLSGDNFSIESDNQEGDMGTEFGNSAAVLVWEHKLGRRFDYRVGFSYTGSYSEFDGFFGEGYLSVRNLFERYSGYAEVEVNGQSAALLAGVRHSEYRTLPQDMQLVVSADSASYYHYSRNRQTDYYLEGTVAISPSFDVSGGIKLHNYFTPSISEYYNEEGPFDAEHWIENRGRLMLSGSLAVKWKAGSNSYAKAAFSHQTQTVHLASIASLPLPNDIWLMSSPFLEPQTGNQVSAGYYWRQGVYVLSFELFARDMKNQVLYTMGDIDDDRKVFEERFFVGRGRVVGAELMAKRTVGRFTWDLGYTLLRSERSYDEINNGEWFPDKFDRRHDLALMGAFKVNNRWKAAASFIYATGNTLNLPSGRMWVMGTIMNDYEGYNNFRMPPYHRLDLSATYRLQTTLFKESELTLSVINVYNRANPYFLFYRIGEGKDNYSLKVSAHQVSLFPILPSIGFRVRF